MVPENTRGSYKLAITFNGYNLQGYSVPQHSNLFVNIVTLYMKWIIGKIIFDISPPESSETQWSMTHMHLVNDIFAGY